jgi:uncharacterized protein (TIGR03085 family)
VTFAQSERAELCDLFEVVGPSASTLCQGWTAEDLAAHLWIRENDPIGATGLLAKPLSGLLERRMAEVKQRWDFLEVVSRIRRGPARLSVFAIPGVDEGANSTEFFIHHEDVRRAAHPVPPARDLGADVEEWMWRRLKLLARAWFRRAPVAVVLERVDPAAGDHEPDQIRAMAGNPIVTLVGRPSELLLYANGRGEVAEVQVIGEPDAVATLNDADLRV